MIETLRSELRSIEEGMQYMEATDTAWSRDYTYFWLKRRILKSFIRRLERLEKRYGGRV